MIGLDTNVLIRYIAQDDAVQSPRAVKLIENECSSENPGFVGLITLAELVWVSETCYNASRTDVAVLIRRLLSIKQLVVQEAEVVWKALREFEDGKADFSDHLVEKIAAAQGCEHTFTFDKTAARAGMLLLK
ncbi:MAG TPA: type II toxin-antitoxin system VapC family toxin [Candidatus Obscuribacterales bacterium]